MIKYKNKMRWISYGLYAIGCIYVLVSIFHSNLWFDESYSVAIARHSFSEIWQITANDVHPPFYYWLLHLLYLIFDGNIIVYRIFSALGIMMTALLGLTYIKKDFGYKVSFWYIFLIFFTPVVLIYANEIRMYSWSMFFVTLTFIYAYRYGKNFYKKDLILFILLSVVGAYTHYYALIADCVINLMLILRLVKVKSGKQWFDFLIAALLQIVMYIPWGYVLVNQVATVSDGFWISLSLFETPIQILGFQFGGNLDFESLFQFYFAAAVGMSAFVYMTIRFIQLAMQGAKFRSHVALIAVFIYLGVIAVPLCASLFMESPVLYARYLFVASGVWAIGFAYILSKEKGKQS